MTSTRVDSRPQTCYTAGVIFDIQSGQVRILSAQGFNRIAFRIDVEGIYVWDRDAKQEVLIPWASVEGWRDELTTT